MILFEVGKDSAKQVKPMTTVNGKKVLERDIQRIFEGSLHEILGVHFLASEYATSFGGRTDTLGSMMRETPASLSTRRSE